MWLRIYIKALVAVMLSGLMYGVALPHAVSAQDSLLVLAGIFGALAWPAVVIIYFRKELRKLKQCVKF